MLSSSDKDSERDWTELLTVSVSGPGKCLPFRFRQHRRDQTDSHRDIVVCSRDKRRLRPRMTVLRRSAVDRPSRRQLRAQMKRNRLVSRVAQQKHHREVFSATDTELRRQQRVHYVEIVGWIKSLVERPRLPQLD